jgi:hypothetical protein
MTEISDLGCFQATKNDFQTILFLNFLKYFPLIGVLGSNFKVYFTLGTLFEPQKTPRTKNSAI